jgi:pantoate--beta-alanine ligase
MGALHEGHGSLIKVAGAQCGRVAVSIFVNPLQFGPAEDLEAYPRTLERDVALCERLGCDWVFAPAPREMYPDHTLTRVSVRQLGEVLCGGSRPGHFDGVATVVCKLLNIVGPDEAFFGEKDFQQLVVIRRMVRDLNLPITIVGCPTVREPDGLAMSSRNVYLSPEERHRATSVYAALREAARAVKEGERDSSRLVEQARAQLAQAQPAGIDYVEIVDPDTLAPMPHLTRPARMCVAVRFGAARLIDNIALEF